MQVHFRKAIELLRNVSLALSCVLCALAALPEMWVNGSRGHGLTGRFCQELGRSANLLCQAGEGKGGERGEVVLKAQIVKSQPEPKP